MARGAGDEGIVRGRVVAADSPAITIGNGMNVVRFGPGRLGRIVARLVVTVTATGGHLCPVHGLLGRAAAPIRMAVGITGRPLREEIPGGILPYPFGAAGDRFGSTGPGRNRERQDELDLCRGTVGSCRTVQVADRLLTLTWMTDTAPEYIGAIGGCIGVGPPGGGSDAGRCIVMLDVTGRQAVSRCPARLMATAAGLQRGGGPECRTLAMAPGHAAGGGTLGPGSGEVPHFQEGNIKLPVDMLDIGSVVNGLTVGGNGIGMAFVAGCRLMRNIVAIWCAEKVIGMPPA